MILLTVNGLEPGESYRGSRFPMAVNASIAMHSTTPVTAAEIVVNGRVQPVPLTPKAGKKHLYGGSVRLTLETSSWVAARWVQETSTGNCAFAHTSPVYFRHGDAPIPVPRPDAEYLLRRVEALIQEVGTGRSQIAAQPTTIESNTETLRREQLRYLNRARDVYRTKLDQAR